MTDIIITITIFTIAMIIILGIIWHVERSVKMEIEDEKFNGGRCPVCSNKFKYVETDYRGRRGYHCDNCGYFTWISLHRIDKNYSNELK